MCHFFGWGCGFNNVSPHGHFYQWPNTKWNVFIISNIVRFNNSSNTCIKSSIHFQTIQPKTALFSFIFQIMVNTLGQELLFSCKMPSSFLGECCPSFIEMNSECLALWHNYHMGHIIEPFMWKVKTRTNTL